MTFEIPTDVQSDLADDITAQVDAGAGAGTLEIRDGAIPAVNVAATGTLLATLPMSDPSFPAAVNGVITANAITDDTSTVAGTASYFRVEDSDGNTVLQGNVQTSGGDLNLNSLAITAGGTVSVTSFVVTMPAS